jgi:hypothetical protein
MRARFFDIRRVLRPIVRPIARLDQGQEPGQPCNAEGAGGAVVIVHAPSLQSPIKCPTACRPYGRCF